MSKINPDSTVTVPRSRAMSTKTLAYAALLAALSVVFARLIVPMPNAYTRFSIEAVPIFLAGSLFGPLVGGLVGFSADLVGCLFSGYGYNPIFAIPPILYGICGGLFQMFLSRKMSFGRVLLSFLPAVIFGSILYQSVALSYIYSEAGAFLATLITRLSTRSVQFALTIVIDAAIVNFLFKSKIFDRSGVWPPAKAKSNERGIS